mmetsp:Transcript_8711/g.14804  ORF Transcript_8711/g.14804 Transcript_8711/m.14804 type:complete len:293 (-) Transcript_8711:2054-2932(-)
MGGAVHRACVLLWHALHHRHVGAHLRLEVNEWHGDEEFTGQGLCDEVVVKVPACAFQEQSTHVSAIFGLLIHGDFHFRTSQHAEVKLSLVDGGGIFTREVLQRASDECLGEEESTHPEDIRRGALGHPVIQESNSVQQVRDPWTQRLQGRVCDGGPQRRYLADHHGVAHLLELHGHQHQALDGLLHIRQRDGHFLDEAVEADQLLSEHGVHRFVVPDREHNQCFLNVEHRRQAAGDVLRKVIKRLAPALALATETAWLQTERRVEQRIGLRDRTRDIRIVVQAEDFGPFVER